MLHRMFRHVPWIACLLVLACVSRGHADVTSTFDSDSENWTAVSHPFRSHVEAPSTSDLPYDGTFGNPVGSVRLGDVYPNTGVSAPPQYLGDKSAYYGGTLTYDIYIRFSDDIAYPAVVLNGGTMSLYYDAPSPQVDEWETVVVELNESGWTVSGSTTPASQAQLQEVLANLVGLYIDIEWNTGPDDTSVDNVTLADASPVESASWAAIKALYHR